LRLVIQAVAGAASPFESRALYGVLVDRQGGVHKKVIIPVQPGITVLNSLKKTPARDSRPGAGGGASAQ
jgi:hypothetical protein